MVHIDDSILNEYLDRQLDAAEQERVAGHLAECEDCQERLAEMENLFAGLAVLPEVALAVDLSERVVARLSAEFKPRPIPRWTIPVFALQLVAALVLFIWLWPMVQPVLGNVGELMVETAENLQPNLPLSDVAAPLIDTLESGLERLAEISEGLSPHASLSILEGFLIIGLALILWLAGSGLLLRQSLVIQNNSLKEG